MDARFEWIAWSVILLVLAGFSFVMWLMSRKRDATWNAERGWPIPPVRAKWYQPYCGMLEGSSYCHLRHGHEGDHEFRPMYRGMSG